MQTTKTHFIPFALALALSTFAVAASYNAVDVTLKQGAGPLTVGLSTRVSPTLGAVNPPVKNGVAYVGASHATGSWNVGLSPKLPLSLNIRHETGSSEMNLKGLPLTRLNVVAGAGPVELQLPSRTLSASVIQDTGSLDIYLPADTGLQLVIKKFETGSLTIEGADVATGTDLSGTFQTANFDSARYRVTLNLTHGAGRVEVFKPGSQTSNSAASTSSASSDSAPALNKR